MQHLECVCAGKASLGVGAYPLSYCTFGAAVTEVELDALTGEQRILRSDILFDCGRSMNPALDMGQVSVGLLLEPPLPRGHCGKQHKELAMYHTGLSGRCVWSASLSNSLCCFLLQLLTDALRAQ